ncbi:MAG: flagellar biosynthetic protein FliO [Magnetococcus sp. WYHC-3]
MMSSVRWLLPGVLGCLPTMAVWAAEDGAAVIPAAQPVDLWGEGARILGYLLVLVVLGVLATRVGRGLQPRLGLGPIEVVGARHVGPGAGVRLVRVGTRCWLIGVTREHVSLIAELTEKELPTGHEQPDRNQTIATPLDGVAGTGVVAAARPGGGG